MLGRMTKSRGLRVKRGTRSAWVAENQGRYVCQCGCAKPVPLRPEHFNVGVPRYLHGHNAKADPPNKRPPKARALCGCGCGALTAPGRRYLSGHNNRGQTRSDETRRKLSEGKLGPLNPQFGKRPATYRGWHITPAGYKLIHSPEHPFATANHFVPEHRLIVENHLRATNPDSPYLVWWGDGLYLRRDLEVHHIDGVKDNNVIENLQVLTKAEHARLHHKHGAMR